MSGKSTPQDKVAEKLSQLQKKYEGLTPEELIQKLAQYDAEAESLESTLKSDKEKAVKLEKENQKLKAELEKQSASAKRTNSAKRQGALQQKYFDKTFPAQIEGKVKLKDDNGNDVEVTIVAGVSHVVHVANIMGDFSIGKVQIGTDKEGNPILAVVKDNFNRIRLAPVVQYADKVPAFKELLQRLYDAKINVLADVDGNPLFAPGGTKDTESIIKID